MSREGIRRLLWRSVRTSLIMTVLLAAIVIGIPLRSDAAISRRTELLAMWYLLAVLVIGTLLTTRSSRRSWSSFSVEFGPDFIARSQFRMPDVRLLRSDVVAVEEMAHRGLLVRTADSERFIFVPEGLDDYAGLRAGLAEWRPIRTVSAATHRQRQWLGISAALLAVIWMIATMLSANRFFVVPSAFGLSVFLLWAFIAAQRSLHLDRRTKFSMWFVVFPILVLTLKTVYLLSAMAVPR